jgi:hypothetical protein
MALALVITSPALAWAPEPSAPGNATQESVANPSSKPVQAQDPAWILKKNSGQIRRPGFHVISNGVFPSADELATSVVETTMEPSANIASPYLGNKDDADHSYTDHNMVDLCAPGALTNALYYWNPYLVDDFGTYTDLSVKNNHPSGVTLQTYWSLVSFYDNHPLQGNYQSAHRGNIMYLAWVSNPGGLWNQYNTGVMDSQHYPSYGATLQDMTSVLSWEASGESVGYDDYFYTIQWSDDGVNDSQASLLTNVEDDIVGSGVPVVAEVDASDLGNEWPSNGGLIRHAITIIGYDNNTGKYDYTDTCGSQTGCGPTEEQQVYTLSQSQMWKAIDAVPYDQGTGDGGWVW